jgi:hypothetical protein
MLALGAASTLARPRANDGNPAKAEIQTEPLPQPMPLETERIKNDICRASLHELRPCPYSLSPSSCYPPPVTGCSAAAESREVNRLPLIFFRREQAVGQPARSSFAVARARSTASRAICGQRPV